MKIIEKNYSWSGYLTKRKKTECIVLHHAAAFSCMPDDIHRIHLMNGWAGIGYHFYILKDGSIYRGRPIDMQGAHTQNYNSSSLGICFEGNFQKETMNDAQLKSGQALLRYIKGIYPNAEIKKHSDLNSTACPGKNFPFDKFLCDEITDAPEIVKSLNQRGIMTNLPLWNVKCYVDTNAYWLARKICNMTKNAPALPKPLESINDIVWELYHRGIIEDKALWLKLFKADKDLYFLGYKAANKTQNKAVI